MRGAISGATAILLAAVAGALMWFGVQSQETDIPDAPPPPEPEPLVLPEAGEEAPVEGEPPPEPPKAYKASREELRFNRYDRNRDEIITRLEMMSSRTKGFKALDKDGNNLLTFEEWAAATSNRFAGADKDGDQQLTRVEFRTTRPKRPRKTRCRC